MVFIGARAAEMAVYVPMWTISTGMTAKFNQGNYLPLFFFLHKISDVITEY